LTEFHREITTFQNEEQCRKDTPIIWAWSFRILIPGVVVMPPMNAIGLRPFCILSQRRSTMSYEFNCPHCNQKLEAEDGMQGEILSCPDCNKEIEVPSSPSHKADAAPPTPKKVPQVIAPVDQTIWWYRNAAGEQKEISEAELVNLIKSNQVGSETPVWRTGMEDWIQAKDCPEFSMRSTEAALNLNEPPAPAQATPVLSQEPVWCYRTDQEEQKQISETELLNMVRTNAISPDAAVWRDGLDNWVCVKDSAVLNHVENLPANQQPFLKCKKCGFKNIATVQNCKSCREILLKTKEKIPTTSQLRISIFFAFLMIFLGWAIAVVGIVYSFIALHKHNKGDVMGAIKAAKNMRIWISISFLLFFITVAVTVASAVLQALNTK